MPYLWWYVTWTLSVISLRCLIVGWGILQLLQDGRQDQWNPYVRNMLLGVTLFPVAGILWLFGLERWLNDDAVVLALLVSMPVAFLCGAFGAGLIPARTRFSAPTAAAFCAALGVYLVPLVLW